MSPVGSNPNFADVNGSSYKMANVTVGTSQVEAKCDATRDPERQLLVVYNASNQKIYYGPTGVTTSTGIPLEKSQEVAMPVGNVGVFLIAATAGNVVRVQEFG